MASNSFNPGDRVQLVLHYDLWGAPPPQATVISTSNRYVRCKMDHSGKMIRFLPQDLRNVAAEAPA